MANIKIIDKKSTIIGCNIKCSIPAPIPLFGPFCSTEAHQEVSSDSYSFRMCNNSLVLWFRTTLACPNSLIPLSITSFRLSASINHWYISFQKPRCSTQFFGL
ncbi:hypothetical protein FKM82_022528 [Ascaphus truei]